MKIINMFLITIPQLTIIIFAITANNITKINDSKTNQISKLYS